MKDRLILLKNKLLGLLRFLLRGLHPRALARGAAFFAVCTVVNFLVFVLLILAGVNIYVTQIASLAAKKACDLLLHRRFVLGIRAALELREVRRFFALLPASVIISLFGIFIFSTLLRFGPIQSKLLTFALGGLFNGFWRSYLYIEKQRGKQ